MYSILLYMKTRVTFRVDSTLADALRGLENQTKFVEDALREALGRTCPLCQGEGRLPLRRVRVTNVRAEGLRRLNRAEARQLQRLYRIGQQVAVTRIELTAHGERVAFSLRREQQELLGGLLATEAADAA